VTGARARPRPRDEKKNDPPPNAPKTKNCWLGADFRHKPNPPTQQLLHGRNRKERKKEKKGRNGRTEERKKKRRRKKKKGKRKKKKGKKKKEKKKGPRSEGYAKNEIERRSEALIPAARRNTRNDRTETNEEKGSLQKSFSKGVVSLRLSLPSEAC